MVVCVDSYRCHVVSCICEEKCDTSDDDASIGGVDVDRISNHRNFGKALDDSCN